MIVVIIAEGHYYVLQCDPRSGRVIDKSGSAVKSATDTGKCLINCDEFCYFFSNEAEAVAFCKAKRAEIPDSEYWVFDWQHKFIEMFRPELPLGAQH